LDHQPHAAASNLDLVDVPKDRYDEWLERFLGAFGHVPQDQRPQVSRALLATVFRNRGWGETVRVDHLGGEPLRHRLSVLIAVRIGPE
jgi:hypothetical protein